MDRPDYEVVVVGGGPAGGTAALYTTRLGHETVVVDRGGGRHTAAAHVHNLYGVSEAVSGADLSRQSREQLSFYGADYLTDHVRTIERDGDGFRVDAEHHELRADRVVLATGFRDVPPNVEGLSRYTGRGLHYCLHCDAYGMIDEPVYVLGHDEQAAEVAMIMCNFTADVDLLMDGDEPTWDRRVDRQVGGHPVDVVPTSVSGAYDEDPAADEPHLGGLRFDDGSSREYTGGFARYGSRFNTELAEGLGCDLAEDGAVAVDEVGRTSVDGVYAVGDVTHGQNQTVVAAGDGALAGIAIHKELRRFPRSPEAVETEGPVTSEEVPAVLDELRERANAVGAAETMPGLTLPEEE